MSAEQATEKLFGFNERVIFPGNGSELMECLPRSGDTASMRRELTSVLISAAGFGFRGISDLGPRAPGKPERRIWMCLSFVRPRSVPVRGIKGNNVAIVVPRLEDVPSGRVVAAYFVADGAAYIDEVMDDLIDVVREIGFTLST